MHLCLSIPPKYSVAHAIGFLKGKGAVRVHPFAPLAQADKRAVDAEAARLSEFHR